MASLTILFTIFFLTPVTMAKPSTYIIHMALSAMPKPFSDHNSWFSATLSSVSDRKPEIIYAYTDSIHGFSATLTVSELESLKRKPGYVSFTRDFPLKIHTTHTPRFLGLNENSGLWPVSNYGHGIIIGFVDTGIWPESESFRDEGMGGIPSRWKGKCEFNNSSLCNKKLIGARVFNKGSIANSFDLRTKTEYLSPRDTMGHGTHISSIAAGNYMKGASYFGYASGTANGIAPRAHIAMYKAVWDDRVYASDVAAAIDQAIQDGVDVLSLSLGLSEDGVSLRDDPIAVASFAAMEKGIFVIASGGNDGPYYWSVMNGAPWMMTVGAGTIDRQFKGVLTLGNRVEIPFPSLYPGNFSTKQSPIVFMESCDLTKGNKKIKNKIIVCNDDSETRSKLEKAGSTGVTAAIFITDDSLISQSYIKSSFPLAFIRSQHLETLKDYIEKNKNPAAKLEFQITVTGTKPAPEVDSYSSRGPFPSCPYVLKPDIFAPGTLILSSWSPISSVSKIQTRPLFSNFNIMSGTSMASPHIAGVAALLKHAYPNWSTAAIKSAIMTTADSLDNTLSQIKDTANKNLPASPLDIGAGHVNPNKALAPGLIYDITPEDLINFLCAMKFTAESIRTITRSNFSHKCKNPSLDLNYPSFITYFNDDQETSREKITVKEFQRTLTNVIEGRRSYNVRIRGLKGLKVNVEPKRLVFKEKNERQSYKLRLEGPRLLQESVVYGMVSWVDDDGKYVVNSPVVATSLVQDSSL